MHGSSTVLSSSVDLVTPARQRLHVLGASALGLIIEKDSSVAVRFAEVLDEAGFHALVVKNDRQVVALLSRYCPHLVVVDVSAPRQEVADMVGYVRLRRPRAHFVGVTRNPKEWDANLAVELGLDGLHTVWPERGRLLRLCRQILGTIRRR